MEETTNRYKKAFESRIVRSFVFGLIITLLSYVFLGFNLSTAGGIRITDDVNRYFDTCVGEGFVSSTPKIITEERGFPLSWHQKDYVPVCDQPGIELKKNTSSSIDFGAFGANILVWMALFFVVSRKFTLRKRLKVKSLE